MTPSPNPDSAVSPPASRSGLRAWLCLLGLGVLMGLGAASLWRPHPSPAPVAFDPASEAVRSVAESARKVDEVFAQHWREQGIESLPRAGELAVARRLSLALTGSIPSLEEIRAIESQPDGLQVAWWATRLLDDSRFANYTAERLTRAFVGVENGPFLVFRRQGFVRWLSEQIRINRPYDQIVRDLITAEGLWTTNPAANFITATIDNNNQGEGIDQVKLAIRTTRAFLGVRIDCVQCHDDKMGNQWKQEDFHQLAAYFAGSQMVLTGVRDDRNKPHEVRFRGDDTERTVLPAVPFHPELLPVKGRPRERLAAWATDPSNLAFSRATVNRVWALMFGRGLVEPIDDISLDPASHPPGLEILAADFVEHGFDLQRLIKVIASTRAFQMESRSSDPASPVTESQEKSWAAFPLVRLRPEQIAGSVMQASYVDTVDESSPFFIQLAKFGQTNEFVKRYGDFGEEEFKDPGGTIPQRLLMMNGKLVEEPTGGIPIFHPGSRILTLSPDPAAAVENAYLCVFTRRPSETEREHFVSQLSAGSPQERNQAMNDLYWSLFNSTEFSWNH